MSFAPRRNRNEGSLSGTIVDASGKAPDRFEVTVVIRTDAATRHHRAAGR